MPVSGRQSRFTAGYGQPGQDPLEEVPESVLFFHETRIKTGDVQLERRYRTAPPVLCMPGEIQQVVDVHRELILADLKRLEKLFEQHSAGVRGDGTKRPARCGLSDRHTRGPPKAPQS
jgi:hypothetical protein